MLFQTHVTVSYAQKQFILSLLKRNYRSYDRAIDSRGPKLALRSSPMP
jgi:hypothetical protein